MSNKDKFLSMLLSEKKKIVSPDGKVSTLIDGTELNEAIAILKELTDAASSNPGDETPRLTSAIVAARKYLDNLK